MTRLLYLDNLVACMWHACDKMVISIWVSVESKKGSKTHMQKQYSSRVKHCIISKRSYTFQFRDVKFSVNAEDDLNKIVSSIEDYGEESDKVQEKCYRFFERYGSHICMGPINFGGIYWWTCCSEDFHQEELQCIERIQSEVLSSKMCASYQRVGASGKVNIEHVRSRYKEEVKSNALCKTELFIRQRGGPECCSLSEWKTGLERNNRTWRVIGRGKSFTPIWEIIRSNYMDQFSNATLLAKVLRKFWQRRTGLLIMSHELSDVLDNVRQWCKDLEVSRIDEHLENLVEVKKKLKDESGSYKVWTDNYLSEMVIQNFLMSVIDKYDSISQSSPNDLKVFQWRSSLHQLIEVGDISQLKSVEHQERIRHILNCTSHPKHSTSEECIECTDIKSLIVHLEKAEGMILMKESAQDATVRVAKAIDSFRYQLRNDQIYDDLFILTILFPFAHSASEHKIIKQLSYEKIKYLCNQLKEQTIEFNKFKAMSPLHVQACLFKICVEIFCTGITSIEQTKEHLQYMEKRIGEKLENKILRIILSTIEEHDWDKLKSDLDSILQEETIAEETSDKLLPILSDETHVHITPEGEVNRQEMENDKIHKMFTELGLINNRLTTSNCIGIQSKKLEVSKCTDPKLLPMIILHKIMTYDIRCREVLLNFDDVTCSDSDDSFSDDETYGAVCTSKSFTLHPQDGLLAVLCSVNVFIKQDLIARLVTCQYAVPLIYPEPLNNTLTVNLWGMRSIVKEWISDGVSKEYPLIAYPMPIIVFLRFGKYEVSKSKTLNTVLNHSSTCYNHFFNRECKGGELNRVLGDGLVDICWYLPTGNSESDLFPDSVAFLNLHGDSRKHKTQIALLSKMSSMCFILLKDNDIDDDGIEIIKHFSASPGKIVLLRIANCKLAEDKKQKLREVIPNLSFAIQNMPLTGRATEKIVSRICDKWKHLTKEQESLEKRITDAVSKCNDKGLKTDESARIEKAKRLASSFQAIFEKISSAKGISSAEVKQKLLPLQGEAYWKVWTKLERERCQMLECDISTRIISLQNGRAVYLRSLSPLMENFLSSLLKYPKNERKYFLQFIQLYLNEHSRKHIRQLDNEFQERIEQCRTTEQRDECKILHLEAKSKETFGLEHVLRETGQVYAAAQKTYPNYQRLPRVAAELLIEGYPLELLDGDSAHVPLEWVSAVLKIVDKKLHNPKVLVLSVLGVQSSGKSTLLNATFGVRFAVSAGRCTRGAFMQLLPICDDLKDQLDCKYLLVIDTEGLHALELRMDPKHDNELATFVIGLANVTLINIFGEIPANIEHILQTVIYAFIRMRRVSLKPSCQFVHQNVSPASAQSKGEWGRHLFKDKLDLVTKMIAAAEDVADEFTCFSDVIAFNPEKDVHYFPPLWNGELPMAHYSQGYCEKTQVLRARILEVMSKQSDKLSSFRRRLEDLWDALLHENFILSFHNSLEAIAYKKLEAMYRKWTWKFQREILKWNEQSKMEIRNSETQDIPKLQKRLEDDLTEYADTIHSEINEELENLFQELSIISHHKDDTRDKLNNLKKAVKDHSIKQYEQAIDFKHLHSSIDEIKGKHDKKIIDEIAVLAENLIQKQSVQIEEEFNTEWEKWIRVLQLECTPFQRANISNAFKDALMAEFKHSAHLRHKLMKDLNEWGLSLSIHVQSKHFQKRADHDKVIRRPIRNYRYDKLLEKAANEELKQVVMYVKTKQDEVFDQFFATELIEMMKSSIADIRQKFSWGKHINLKEEFKLDMILIACGFASREFEKIACEIKKKYDPVEYFQGKKKFYYVYLKKLHSRVAKDVAAASAFCQLLTNSIKESVIASLGPVIVSDMKSTCTFLQTKSALKAKILIDLAEDLKEKEDFHQYEVYLINPDRTMWNSLERHTKDYCMKFQEGRDAINIVYLATKKLREILHFVQKQIVSITNHMPTIQESTIDGRNWLSTVSKDRALQRKLHLDFQACRHFSDFDRLNKDTFLTEILRGLHEFEISLIEEFETKTRDYVDCLPKAPHAILYKSMKGCEETCPFCGEQCEGIFEHKGNHTVSQHRPQCLAGYSVKKTQEMLLLTCNEVIGKKRVKFKNKHVQKWHRFSDYRTVYANWIIKDDISSGASIYWKWFLGAYPENISEVFKIKATTIPPQWTALNWTEVKEALQDATI